MRSSLAVMKALSYQFNLVETRREPRFGDLQIRSSALSEIILGAYFFQCLSKQIIESYLSVGYNLAISRAFLRFSYNFVSHVAFDFSFDLF